MSEQVEQQNGYSEEAPNPEILPRWEVITLAVVDMVVLLIFGAIGRRSHELATVRLIDIFDSGMPFVITWLAISPVLGAFSGKTLFPLKRVISRTLLAGLVAGPLGVLLWGALRGRWPDWFFFPVATGTIMLMLLVWRVIWSRVRRMWWPELP